MCPVDKPSPVAVLLILSTIPYLSSELSRFIHSLSGLSFLAMLVGHMPMIYCSRSAGVGAWRGAGVTPGAGDIKDQTTPPPPPPHSQSRQKLAAYVPSCCEDENDTRESLGISTIWNVTHSADSRTHADTGEYDQLLRRRDLACWDYLRNSSFIAAAADKMTIRRSARQWVYWASYLLGQRRSLASAAFVIFLMGSFIWIQYWLMEKQ